MNDPNANTPTTPEISSYQGGPTELDNAASAFIKDFAAKFEPEPESAPEVKAEGGVPAENTVQEPEKPADKAEDRGLERLVEREVSLRTKEQALFQREERVAALERKIQELESKALPQNLREMFEYSPEEALKALGQDPEQLVRQVIANRLGAEAPPEVRQTVEQSRLKRELAELRGQMMQHQRMLEAQAFVNQIQTGAREFVAKGLGELNSAAPTVASVAKTNPERVYREIMEEISKDAAGRVSQDPHGDALPYAEAAKRVEARWSEFKTMFTPPSAPNPGQTSTPAIETAPKPNISPPSTPKPPDRPIAPWLQRTDLEEEGIKAAMAAYRKAGG